MTTSTATPDDTAAQPADAVAVELDALRRRLEAAAGTAIAFPAATDIDYSPLAPLHRYLINHLGDPFVDGAFPAHAKPMEREVIGFVADLLRAPPHDRWGYVAGGGSEANEYALRLAVRRHPDAVVYHSTATHHSLMNILDRVGLPTVAICTDRVGEIDYADLTAQIAARRDRPAIVVANAGTWWHEAIDDVRRIRTILDEAAVRRRHIHVDAAMAGIPLALLPAEQRPGIDFADGADSVVVSGHKFFGTPMPCAAVVVRDSDRAYPTPAATYTGSPNTTLTNSRNGHAAVHLWYAIRTLGTAGLQARADAARQHATDVALRLTRAGWAAHRHPHGVTVVFAAPPQRTAERWGLPVHDGKTHLVCVPGIKTSFVDDLLAELGTAPRRPRLPQQRVNGRRP